MEYSSASASPALSVMGWAESSASASAAGSTMVTPLDQPQQSFEPYDSVPAYNTHTWQPNTLFPREQTQMTPQFDDTVVNPFDRYSLPSQTPLGASTSPYQHTPITPSMTNTPLTPAGSGIHSFDYSPRHSYNIGINYDGQGAYNNNMGYPTPANPYLQPTSRNPSISHYSPLVTEEPFFNPLPAPSQAMHIDNFNEFYPTDPLPLGDFSLFDGDGNPAAFPSTADVSSNGGQMFPDMINMDYEYHETAEDMDDFINEDEMGN